MARTPYGGKLETREAGGFRISRTSYPADLIMPLHCHEDPYFSFILTGGFDERIGSRERHVRSSMLIFRPPGERHAVRFAPVRTQILRVEVPTCLNHRFEKLGIDLPKLAGEIKGPAPFQFRRLAGEFLNRDAASDVILEALCLEMIAGVSRMKPEPEPMARRVEDFLREHLFESLQVSEIAARLGVQASCLSRAFRRERGVPIGEFVRSLRLEWAAGQLATTDRPIGEIAVEAGFWDQAHFCRAFRSVWGATPGKYRKSFASG